MPPDSVSEAEYAVPTVAAARLVFVTLGAAGMVMVTDCVLVVSEIDVAVTVAVCAALVAAGAVKTADVGVWLEREPPVAAQVTPADFESLVTEAESLIVSPPSTVVPEGTMVTPMGAEPPPQPTSPQVIPNHTRVARTATMPKVFCPFASLCIKPSSRRSRSRTLPAHRLRLVLCISEGVRGNDGQSPPVEKGVNCMEEAQK